VSGWGAGYPGVPSEVAKKARAAKAAQGADAQAGAGDTEPKQAEPDREDSAADSPDDARP
jgi:hypothetical protein